MVKYLLAVAAALLLPVTAMAADMPVVPCPAIQAVPFPAFADPPNLRAWTRKQLPHWLLPGCARWDSRKFDILVALAGTFAYAGDADDILRRFAAVSGWRGIQYWSSMDGRSEPFILEQSAVVSDSDDSPRADFTLAELKSRRPLYFTQQDNRSTSTVTYRMRLDEAGSDRFVIEVENVSTMWIVLPVLGPGDIRVTYIVQNLGPGRWGYYSLTGVNGSSGHAESVTSRAVAVYRHVSGLDLLQQAVPPP
jgi:hypothetical protein